MIVFSRIVKDLNSGEDLHSRIFVVGVVDLYRSWIFGVGVVVVVPLLDSFLVVATVPSLSPLLLDFYVVCHTSYYKSLLTSRLLGSHLPSLERSDYSL